ncbi:MAG TPA: histone deacetylase [Vicinamibacterales bacterium]|nr:histone deacetylase [Vicinamibacterales bacterium]
MVAYYTDEFVLPLPDGHTFPMTKYSRLRELVVSEGIIDAGDLRVPEASTREQLGIVHTPRYVDAVIDGTLDAVEQRRIGFPWSPAMAERARRSVGATVAATRQALIAGASANLAGGTHHAFPDHGEGYCVFNDVAVAARIAQREHSIGRVLIVDLDVHQGNGTAAIFADDASVFTLSLHAASNFPFCKEQSDLDVELPDGTGDLAYLAALDDALETAHHRAKPELIFYVAGADPYEGDRLGKLALSIEGLRERDSRVVDLAARLRVPLVLTMAGGYCADVNVIARIHANTVREAANQTNQ